MEWVLAILFIASAILFILSFVRKDASKVDQQIEQLTLNFDDEVNQLQEKIRKIEIDTEITAQETGILSGSSEKRLLLRNVLDLYKRGYSVESIAGRTKQNKEDIEQMLTPYMKAKAEGGKVANEI